MENCSTTSKIVIPVVASDSVQVPDYIKLDQNLMVKIDSVFEKNNLLT